MLMSRLLFFFYFLSPTEELDYDLSLFHIAILPIKDEFGVSHLLSTNGMWPTVLILVFNTFDTIGRMSVWCLLHFPNKGVLLLTLFRGICTLPLLAAAWNVTWATGKLDLCVSYSIVYT